MSYKINGKSIYSILFESDYENWGDENFYPNKFDCITLASSKVIFDLSTGHFIRENMDVLEYSYYAVDHIKALAKKLHSENEEEKINAREEINIYISIARDIANGNASPVIEKYSFAQETDSNRDFSSDLELLSKEIETESQKSLLKEDITELSESFSYSYDKSEELSEIKYEEDSIEYFEKDNTDEEEISSDDEKDKDYSNMDYSESE